MKTVVQIALALTLLCLGWMTVWAAPYPVNTTVSGRAQSLLPAKNVLAIVAQNAPSDLGELLYSEDFDLATAGQSVSAPPLGWILPMGGDVYVGPTVHPGWVGNSIVGPATFAPRGLTPTQKELSGVPTNGVITLSFDAWAPNNSWSGGVVSLKGDNLPGEHLSGWYCNSHRWDFDCRGITGSYRNGTPIYWEGPTGIGFDATVNGRVFIDYGAMQTWGEIWQDGSLLIATPKIPFTTPYAVNAIHIWEDLRVGGLGIDIDNIVVRALPPPRADQTISFTPITDKTYGAADFTVSATASSGLPVTFTASGYCTVTSTGTVHITGAGSGTIIAHQAGDASYSAAPDVSQTFQIYKAAATVTVNGYTGTYDGASHGATGSATGVNGEDLVSLLSLGAQFTNVPGGTSDWIFAGNENYDAQNGSADIVINKASLTITADNKTKYYKAPNPAFTATVSGFVNGETEASLSGTLTFATTAIDTSWVGSYPITPSGLSSNNYNITYVDGALMVLFNGNSGILQPVNQDNTSVFKQGRTIPLKFKVYDDNNMSVGPQPNIVLSFTLNVWSNGTVSDVNEPTDSTTPDTEFRWSPTDKLWIFNLSSKSLLNNRTYQGTITLVDGSAIVFRFGLR